MVKSLLICETACQSVDFYGFLHFGVLLSIASISDINTNITTVAGEPCTELSIDKEHN